MRGNGRRRKVLKCGKKGFPSPPCGGKGKLAESRHAGEEGGEKKNLGWDGSDKGGCQYCWKMSCR